MSDQEPGRSRKLEEKQERRLAEERRRKQEKSAARRRSLVTLGLALGVAALVVFLIMSERNRTETVAGGVAATEAGCQPVETVELMETANHVDEGTDIQYNSTPPTSGDHYGNWADPGFYSTPVEEERLVHNLEHGQIVIWYSPDAPTATVDAVTSIVEDEGIALLAAPYEGLPAGSELAFSAWGAFQACADFSNDVLSQFRAQYQGKGPENVGIPPFEAPTA